MSLELSWVIPSLPLPSGMSVRDPIYASNIFAFKQAGVGYESVVAITAIMEGHSAIPAYIWHLKGSTGELISGPTNLGNRWYQASFMFYTYDASDGGTIYAHDDAWLRVYKVNPYTLDPYGGTGWNREAFNTNEPILTTYSPVSPQLYSSDGSEAYWMYNFYGRIADREIIIGKAPDDYQDEVSFFSVYDGGKKIGSCKVPISYNNNRKFIAVNRDYGYIITHNCTIAPVFVGAGFDPTLSRNRAGRSLQPDPSLFTDWHHPIHMTSVDPVTMNVLRLDNTGGNLSAWCFKQISSPGHICPPVPTRIPRAGRRIDVVTQGWSSTGRLCSNRAYEVEATGDGVVTPMNVGQVSDHQGKVRLSMDCGEEGGYDETIEVSMEDTLS